jgi:plastocyanin
MAFTWQITIDKQGNGFVYDPNPLTDVASGDQIIWTNNDDQPHHPSLLPNEIPPDSPSDTYVADETVTYTDLLHAGFTGTITVS